MTTLNWALVNSGLGTFAVGGTDDSLVEVRFPDQLPERLDHSPLSALVSQAARELEEFLSGARQSFDLPLRLEGTIFQNAVWGAIEHIPYGTVATYGEVAKMINKPSSARAVGRACGANPLPLLRPCHRVVAAQGLGGFGGGAQLKTALLALEAG